MDNNSNPFLLAELLGPKGPTPNGFGLKTSTPPLAKNQKAAANVSSSDPYGSTSPEEVTAGNQSAAAEANSDLTPHNYTAVAPNSTSSVVDAAAAHAYFAANPQMALSNMAPIPAIGHFLFGQYGGPLSWLSSKLPGAARQEGVIPYGFDQLSNLFDPQASQGQPPEGQMAPAGAPAGGGGNELMPSPVTVEDLPAVGG